VANEGFSEIIARNIPGAGHAVVIEQPATVEEEIWKAVSLR